MLSLCKPRVLRAACPSSSPCCAALPVAASGATSRRGCSSGIVRSSGATAATGGSSSCSGSSSSSSSRAVGLPGVAKRCSGRGGSMLLRWRAVASEGVEGSIDTAPETAAAVAQQRLAQCFLAAAARVLPVSCREPPPAPPPLSELPALLPADSIPPLLEWVMTARMRAVAVQSILEQHCSPGVLQIVAAAAQLVEAEQQADKGGSGGGTGRSGILITSAHLALAALAHGDADCAAALGVLHHASAGLSLQRCSEILAGRAAEERRWEERWRRPEEEGHEDGGSSIFSSPALHFLFQSYRWAVFTGCGTVQPCHLLWAMAADPRVSYSPRRSDPLVKWIVRVTAMEAREPPLVWLLQQCPETLPRPAAVYEQMLGVMQRGMDAAADAAAEAEAGDGSTEQAAGGAAAGSCFSGSSSCAALEAAAATGIGNTSINVDARSGHNGSITAAAGVCDAHAISGNLDARLDELGGCPSAHDLDELAALLRACRLAGHVPSRERLQGLDAAFLACAPQNRNLKFHGSVERWRSVYELAEGFAALGYQPATASRNFVVACRNVDRGSPPPGVAAAAAADVYGRVQWWCRVEAGMSFCYPKSQALLSTSFLMESEDDAMTSGGCELELLLAVADLPPDVWGRSEVAGALANSLHYRHTVARPTLSTLLLAGELGGRTALAYVLECLAVQAGARECMPTAGRSWESSSAHEPLPANAAAQALRRTFTLPVRAALLQALSGAPPSSFYQELRTALTKSLDLDSSSIHASLGVQQRVAQAYTAADCGVPEGWLQQLASYGDVMRGGSSEGMAEALVAMLAAASSAAAEGAGGCDCGDSGECDDDDAATQEHASSASSIPPQQLLGRLAVMLEDAAAAGDLPPSAALEALRHVHALTEAAEDAEGCFAATRASTAAVLKLGSAPSTRPASLKPLVEVMEEVAGSALPPLLLGSRLRQLQAVQALLGDDEQQRQAPPERRL